MSFAAVLALLLLTLAAVFTPGAALAATVDKAHPYSNPVWFPLRTPTQSDCEKSNPGCFHNGAYYHGHWAMDIDELPPYPKNAPVPACEAPHR